jgi:type I restriction-modification system DNA methylase subunit
MSDIDSFREKLQALLAKFEKDKNHYLSKGYPEAQVRIDFLNPFFKALGWDIENKAQKPPHERDVIVELSPETTGRPDYNFRIHGATKFFVEAKAPSVALDEVNHILQAKSYAWSTKEVFFVILTDFEEFKLFDASLKPNPKFPNEGLIFNFKYTEYLNNIEKLLELSRERVEQGSLEALLPRDTKSKRLRIPPDKSFLEELTIWRTELAKDVHRCNPDFDGKLLNDVVQKLLDRIIFVRIAEDRKIRPDRELWEIVAQWKEEGKRKPIMTHLLDLFYEVNDDLNGDIFKPHACEKAEVDSNLLADIIENLYFPKSRYRFDAIGVELLGSIYERYLGSTIRVTPQRVKVEEKPEVRKAGGVYYTPKYIVDYIVKNTVAKIIEGKTPRQIANIKILDPACGSGSFLLSAYQCLIDYHLEYYRNHPKEAQTQFFDFYYKVGPDELALPLRTKAAILRNNIFGVDIDPQAVEITMMSLYLKALEGERGLLPRKQHLLPPLSNNIKCGNSLIGYDIFENPSTSSLSKEALSKFPPLVKGGQGGLLNDETKSRINPFDWNSKSTGFGEIMETGGFDVVIGNPPYLRVQGLQEYYCEQIPYFINTYQSAVKRFDLYLLFVEKGFKLLKKKGFLGFICPNKFINSDFGSGLREYLIKNNAISSFINFGHNLIFKAASIYTGILILNKEKNKELRYYEFQNMPEPKISDHLYSIKGRDFSIYSISQLTASPWVLTHSGVAEILIKIKQPLTLGDVFKEILVGIQSGIDNIYVLKFMEKTDRDVFRFFSERAGEEIEIESRLVKPLLRGEDVHRYAEPKYRYHCIYPYILEYDRTKIVDEHLLRELFPLGYSYLNSYRKELTEIRKRQKTNPKYWYSCHRSRDMRIFESDRIITPEISLGCNMTIGKKGIYHNTQVYSLLPKSSRQENLLYWLGILNSKLMWFFLSNTGTVLRGGYVRFKTDYLKPFPIRTIDFNNPAEKNIHDKLVSAVDRMLQLHNKKNALPPSAEREKIEREITITDEKIDEIVYGLYGITEEERRMIGDS